MNIERLAAELSGDPLGLGYAGMTDAQAAAALNAETRPNPRGVIPAREIIEATAPAEWASLTAAEKQRYQTITGAGDVDVRGANTRAAFMAMFGAGTATRTALAALQNGAPISRAAELGLPFVGAHHVAEARA